MHRAPAQPCRAEASSNRNHQGVAARGDSGGRLYPYRTMVVRAAFRCEGDGSGRIVCRLAAFNRRGGSDDEGCRSDTRCRCRRLRLSCAGARPPRRPSGGDVDWNLVVERHFIRLVLRIDDARGVCLPNRADGWRSRGLQGRNHSALDASSAPERRGMSFGTDAVSPSTPSGSRRRNAPGRRIHGSLRSGDAATPDQAARASAISSAGRSW